MAAGRYVSNRLNEFVVPDLPDVSQGCRLIDCQEVDRWIIMSCNECFKVHVHFLGTRNNWSSTLTVRGEWLPVMPQEDWWSSWHHLTLLSQCQSSQICSLDGYWKLKFKLTWMHIITQLNGLVWLPLKFEKVMYNVDMVYNRFCSKEGYFKGFSGQDTNEAWLRVFVHYCPRFSFDVHVDFQAHIFCM